MQGEPPKACLFCGEDLSRTLMTDDAGSTMCSACGMLIEHNVQLDIDNWGGPGGQRSTGALRNGDDQMMTSNTMVQREELRQLCRLYLPDGMHEHAERLFLQFKTAMRDAKRKIDVKPTILAIVYIVACANNLPIRLDQMRSQDVGKPRVLKMVDKVCRLCNIGEYPRLKPITLIQWIVDTLEIKPPLRSQLIDMGFSVYSCANTCWLAEGRAKGALEVAAVIVAARALKEKRIDSAFAAPKLDMSDRMIQLRVNEIINVFLAATRQIPWACQMTSQNIHLYLPFILDFKHEFFSFENANPALQPSLQNTGRPVEPALQDDMDIDKDLLAVLTN